MVSDVYDYIGMWDSKGQLLTPVKQGEGWGFMNHDGIVKVPLFMRIVPDQDLYW